MNIIRVIFIAIGLLIVAGRFSNAQIHDSHKVKSLTEKVLDNEEMLSKDPESAQKDFSSLMAEATKTQNKEAELLILSNQCRYFYQKLDFENLYTESKKFLSVSESVDSSRFESIAQRYLMDVYFHNNLYDKAELAYQESLSSLSELNDSSPRVIAAKANAHIGMSNNFLQREDPENAIRYLLMAYKEYAKLKDKAERQKSLYWIFSNLASAYVDFNSDSAEYYVNNSILIAPQNQINDKFAFKNHIVLGKIYQNRFDFDKAISEYIIAEEIADQLHFSLNREYLYNRMVECYTATKDTVNEALYKNKLKDIKLTAAENKNKSLQKIIISNSEEEVKNKKHTWYIYGGFIIIITCVITYLLYKKRTIKTIEIDTESYNKLLDAAKENDPAFMYAFEKFYPDFSEKLLGINSDLSQYEIEFCALLKMNLSSKEIAQIKSIETRTVQNRKSSLRRKLNIPESQETNKWFSKL